MRERSELILKITCLVFAALMLFQFSRLVLRRNPLARVNIPAPPSLAADPDTPTGTNAVAPPGPAPAPPSGPAAAPTPAAAAPPASAAGPGPIPGRAPGARPGFGPGPGAIDVPPELRSRVDRIVQSEILGPFMRPLPMALLGIGEQDVFLRAPNGQTGLLKEGDELGGVKLLLIGTNRVLIEHEGQKKGLTVFAGFGSETLLPKEKEKTQ